MCHHHYVERGLSSLAPSSDNTLTTGVDSLTLDNGAHQIYATDQLLNNGDKIAGGTNTRLAVPR